MKSELRASSPDPRPIRTPSSFFNYRLIYSHWSKSFDRNQIGTGKTLFSSACQFLQVPHDGINLVTIRCFQIFAIEWVEKPSPRDPSSQSRVFSVIFSLLAEVGLSNCYIVSSTVLWYMAMTRIIFKLKFVPL